jgi:integrase
VAACNRTWSMELVQRDCAAWPADEQATWIRLFGHPTSPRPWARPTAYQNAGVYTRYLLLTNETGITREGVETFILLHEAEEEVCRRTIAGYVADLVEIGHLLHPGSVDWLKGPALAMKKEADRTPKKREAAIPDAVDLLEHGWKLIRLGRQVGPNRRGTGIGRGAKHRGTLLFRTGFFIVFVLNCPERLRAVADLRLGQIDHERRRITFTADQTKDGKEHPWTVPPEVLELIQEWRTKFRPTLKPTDDCLWSTAGGGPGSTTGTGPCTSTLYAALRKETGELPAPVTPHPIRNAAGTLIVREAPDRAAMASPLLWHKNPKTTAEYTETASMIGATEESWDIIASYRRPGRRRRLRR